MSDTAIAQQMRRRAFIGLTLGGAGLVIASNAGLLPKSSAPKIGPPVETPAGKWEWALADEAYPSGWWKECSFPGYRRFPVRDVRTELRKTARPHDPGEIEIHILSDGAKWEATESGVVYATLLQNGKPFWVYGPRVLKTLDTLTIPPTCSSKDEWASYWEFKDV
jgi:hypothetical protein